MTTQHPDRLEILARIVEDCRHLGTACDFALLPGDIADNGTPAQYALVRDALAPLRLPLRLIPGDHDFEPGHLDAFHDTPGAVPLPAAETIRGHRCLFLDIVSAGTGGPDFRLGAAQLAWLATELADAHATSRPVALFMHSYPDDLGPDAGPLRRLLDRFPPAIVDMGHTHYNELANDGRTVYAATRSTAQIEEGPPGFSVAALDHGAASWRFKPLDAPWPLVLVTTPADHRLATPDAPPRPVVRALAFHEDGIVAATCRIDDAPPAAMHRLDGAWCLPWRPDGAPHRITVRAETASGAAGEDTVLAGPASDPARAPLGSDAHALGAWPERHILGTQLGPNRNGRKW